MNQRHPYLQAGLLTIVAGIADAIGYLTMGGIFAANMTGNTVLAGISAAEGHYATAAFRFIPLLAFFLGAMLARLLLRLFHKPAVPILIEAVLLAGVGFLPIGEEASLMIAALAMETFLGFARGFRSQFARLEKIVGAALVLTGVAFLTGGMQTASSWLIDVFPAIGRLG